MKRNRTKCTQMSARCTESEHQKIIEASKNHNMSIADIMRTGALILAETDKQLWDSVKEYSEEKRIYMSLALEEIIKKGLNKVL